MKKLLKKWLGIIALEEENARLRQNNRELQQSFDRLRQRTKALEAVIDIGVDIHVKGGSWAVFCFRGKSDKTDYIKFVNLDDRTLREVQNFIRPFENCHPAIDMPFAISRSDFMRR